MKTLGITVYEQDLQAVSTKIKLLNQQIWFLEEGYAVKYCYLFEGGKKIPVQVGRVTLHKIYEHIRYIYDKNNFIIAERANAGCRLRTTRSNDWLSIEQEDTSNQALYIYQLIQHIEDREFAKQMLARSRHKQVHT